MQLEDFKAKRIKREDKEWNNFVNRLVNRHVDKFEDPETATRFNKWIVDHLISLHSTQLDKAEEFLTESMKNRSAKEFEEFIESFGEKGKSMQKFEAALKMEVPVVMPKEFVKLAEKITPKINAKGRESELALVLKAAHDAFGKENLLLFTKKSLGHVISKNPGWKGEELAKHVNYLKEHVKISEGGKEEEFERIIGPLLHRLVRKGTPKKGDKTFENVVNTLKMFAQNKDYELKCFYSMAERE